MIAAISGFQTSEPSTADTNEKSFTESDFLHLGIFVRYSSKPGDCSFRMSRNATKQLFSLAALCVLFATNEHLRPVWPRRLADQIKSVSLQKFAAIRS
ncbi:hypothetical protein IVB18_12565 [Bradyrhizobium sp. 186]|uniref:hypothetical protein n=1 Tax=Bradyrhizobium sp. 186 TaxID=2782654 RepID=UPI002001CD35|nr:hypothetical protein [Bradyrhizobium sp. 186]UPK38042.1 hypothetical protein IVB18_12565 [Bradyrhizobium sp. 186]